MRLSEIKLRRKCWNKNKFWCVGSSSPVTSMEILMELSEDNDDWEIVDEPKCLCVKGIRLGEVPYISVNDCPIHGKPEPKHECKHEFKIYACETPNHVWYQCSDHPVSCYHCGALTKIYSLDEWNESCKKYKTISSRLQQPQPPKKKIERLDIPLEGFSPIINKINELIDAYNWDK